MRLFLGIDLDTCEDVKDYNLKDLKQLEEAINIVRLKIIKKHLDFDKGQNYSAALAMLNLLFLFVTRRNRKHLQASFRCLEFKAKKSKF